MPPYVTAVTITSVSDGVFSSQSGWSKSISFTIKFASYGNPATIIYQLYITYSSPDGSSLSFWLQNKFGATAGRSTTGSPVYSYATAVLPVPGTSIMISSSPQGPFSPISSLTTGSFEISNIYGTYSDSTDSGTISGFNSATSWTQVVNYKDTLPTSDYYAVNSGNGANNVWLNSFSGTESNPITTPTSDPTGMRNKPIQFYYWDGSYAQLQTGFNNPSPIQPLSLNIDTWSDLGEGVPTTNNPYTRNEYTIYTDYYKVNNFVSNQYSNPAIQINWENGGKLGFIDSGSSTQYVYDSQKALSASGLIIPTSNWYEFRFIITQTNVDIQYAEFPSNFRPNQLIPNSNWLDFYSNTRDISQTGRFTITLGSYSATRSSSSPNLENYYFDRFDILTGQINVDGNSKDVYRADQVVSDQDISFANGGCSYLALNVNCILSSTVSGTSVTAQTDFNPDCVLNPFCWDTRIKVSINDPIGALEFDSDYYKGNTNDIYSVTLSVDRYIIHRPWLEVYSNPQYSHYFQVENSIGGSQSTTLDYNENLKAAGVLNLGVKSSSGLENTYVFSDSYPAFTTSNGAIGVLYASFTIYKVTGYLTVIDTSGIDADTIVYQGGFNDYLVRSIDPGSNAQLIQTSLNIAPIVGEISNPTSYWNSPDTACQNGCNAGTNLINAKIDRSITSTQVLQYNLGSDISTEFELPVLGSLPVDFTQDISTTFSTTNSNSVSAIHNFNLERYYSGTVYLDLFNAYGLEITSM